MLLGLPPILGPDLLHALWTMGHTDEIALLDGNCPIPAAARHVVRADGHGLIPLLDAILAVMPIDDRVPDAILRSTVGDDLDARASVYDEIAETCARRAPGRIVTPLAGSAFGARLAGVRTIVPTGEPRLYANIILRKGVVHPRE